MRVFPIIDTIESKTKKADRDRILVIRKNRSGKTRKSHSSGKTTTHRSQKSRMKDGSHLDKLVVDNHPTLYRGMSYQQLLDAYEGGFFHLENDFHDGEIKGSSFSTEFRIAKNFADKRVSRLLKEIGEENFTWGMNSVIIEIPPDRLLDDAPLAMERVDISTLINNPALTRHLYNFGDYSFNGDNIEQTNETLLNLIMHFDEKHLTRNLESADDIRKVQEFRSYEERMVSIMEDMIFNDKYKPKTQKQSKAIKTMRFYLDEHTEYKKKKTLREKRWTLLSHPDILDIFDEYPFQSPEEVPIQLLIGKAENFAKGEGEIVTMNPTILGFDDVKIHMSGYIRDNMIDKMIDKSGEQKDWMKQFFLEDD